MMSSWFRTRWEALDWFFRIVLVFLSVFHAVALLVAILPLDWSAMLDALGGFALAYIVCEWQYWEKLGKRTVGHVR